MIVKSFRQAVRAEQEEIAWLKAHGTDLWLNELVAAAERLLQDVAPRMSGLRSLIWPLRNSQPTWVSSWVSCRISVAPAGNNR